MYDLGLSGFLDFARHTNVLEQQYISRDPLVGILDGNSRVFHTNYAPILTSGSVSVFVNGVPTSGSLDYNTGELTLASAPSNQPVANYIFTPFTSFQTLQFLLRGFDQMELLWNRNYQVVDGLGNWATETSSNLYVADTAGNDPVIGSLTFSTSRVQVAFLMACTEYAYLRARYHSAASHDYMWRETVRGMTIDKQKRPANLRDAVAEAKEALEGMLVIAQEQEVYGAFTPNPATLDYLNNYEWQTTALANDNRGQLGYQFGYRSLTYYP